MISLMGRPRAFGRECPCRRAVAGCRLQHLRKLPGLFLGCLGFDLPAMPVIEFRHPPPAAQLLHFASAELRLGRKPPIS